MVRPAIPALLFVAALSGACSHLPGLHPVKNPPPDVRTSAQQYRAGDSGSIYVKNRGSRTIGFNSCPVQLEQLAGSAWRPSPGGIRGPESEAGCNTTFLLLGSGDSTQTRFTLAPTVAPGTYRLRLLRVEGRDFGMGADSVGARTNQFAVIP